MWPARAKGVAAFCQEEKEKAVGVMFIIRFEGSFDDVVGSGFFGVAVLFDCLKEFVV